jgi:hypothetical protein
MQSSMLQRTAGDALFLREGDHVLPYYCAVDAVGQLKSRIDSNIGIARLKVLFDEHAEHELRHLDPVERDRIHMNIALPTAAIGMRFHLHVVDSAEDAEQRV